jgi:hypothetical protein
MFRKCCGYYCAMVAAVALFFYGVIIVMEIRKNQFLLWKMQYPEQGHGLPPNSNWGSVNELMNEKANSKIVPLIFVLVVINHLLLISLA